MDVLIRDLPTEIHAELTRRAAAADKSLRAYVREVLTEHVAVPSMDQWLGRLREMGANHVGPPTGSELVAAARAEDDAMVGR